MGFNPGIAGGSMAAGRAARQERAQRLRALRADLARERAYLTDFQDCLQTANPARRANYREAIRFTEAIIAEIERSLEQLRRLDTEEEMDGALQ